MGTKYPQEVNINPPNNKLPIYKMIYKIDLKLGFLMVHLHDLLFQDPQNKGFIQGLNVFYLLLSLDMY